MTVLHHRPKELRTEVAMQAGYQGLTGSSSSAITCLVPFSYLRHSNVAWMAILHRLPITVKLQRLGILVINRNCL